MKHRVRSLLLISFVFVLIIGAGVVVALLTVKPPVRFNLIAFGTSVSFTSNIYCDRIRMNPDNMILYNFRMEGETFIASSQLFSAENENLSISTAREDLLEFTATLNSGKPTGISRVSSGGRIFAKPSDVKSNGVALSEKSTLSELDTSDNGWYFGSDNIVHTKINYSGLVSIEWVISWNLIETWSGIVIAPAAWSLVETWTGDVSAPANWNLIEMWTGTVEAPVYWNLIETWTGTVSVPAPPPPPVPPTPYIPPSPLAGRGSLVLDVRVVILNKIIEPKEVLFARVTLKNTSPYWNEVVVRGVTIGSSVSETIKIEGKTESEVILRLIAPEDIGIHTLLVTVNYLDTGVQVGTAEDTFEVVSPIPFALIVVVIVVGIVLLVLHRSRRK